MNPSVPSTKGSVDTVAPECTVATLTNDPVLSTSFPLVVSLNKGPVSGAATDDFDILENATLSDWTPVSGNKFLVTANPTIDGQMRFRFKAGGATYVTNNGVSVGNTESNTLVRTYQSGATYDLENAQEISIAQHYRGAEYSISLTNDLLATLNVPGMELLVTKYNFGATMFVNANNSSLRNMYNFGRVDLGVISNTFADFLNRLPLVTAAMSGRVPTTLGFKNGDDSYANDLVPYILIARNSLYGGVPPSYGYYQYAGLTASNLKSRGITFRHDYFQKVTGTDYYSGTTQEVGDTRLSDYVAYVKSQSGWLHDFVHWHWQIGNYPKHFYSYLLSLLGSDDVFCGTQTQVAEYYFVRESVDSVSGNGNVITVTHSKDFATSPYSNIETPLWVKVDLTGTEFEGHDIALSNGLKPRSMGSDVYYIPILLDYSGSSSTVSLGIATGDPSYVNLDIPVPERTGSDITCDQPVKYTIWRTPKETSLTTSTSSADIPSADNTTVNLTVDDLGLSIASETQVKVKHDDSNYFYAWVTSYNPATGAMVLSSFPDAVGSGTYSSWTITNYFHELAAEEVERSLTFSTSYTIATPLDEVNYTYSVGVINSDNMSAVIP